MGGNCSLLPDKLNESDVKKLCGSQYENNMFNSLKDSTDGLIKRDFFLGIVSDNLEKEVYYVFMEFCPTGEMDSRSFVRLLKETKSLKKNVFSSGEADLIFQKYKTKYQSKKYLNYYPFRIDIIPAIAQKRNMEIVDYLKKLAQCKGPSSNGISEPDDSIHHENSTHPLIPKESVGLFSATDEQIKAVIKLQNFHRKTQAKIDVSALRELEEISHQQHPPPVPSLSTEDPLNIVFSNIFLKNSSDITSNEMNLNSFLTFCNRYQLTDSKNLTPNDCRVIFQKTLALGQFNHQLINEFIAYDKRIQYLAFRDITIPLLSTKRKQTIHDCVRDIVEMDQTFLQQSI